MKNEITKEEFIKIQKRMRKIQKNHKLYVRASSMTLFRLDKLSVNIYNEIMVLFLRGDGESLYSKKNKDVKHWSKLKPIFMPLDKTKFSREFLLLKKKLKTTARSVVVSYNGSWKPLVSLELFDTLISKK